MPRLLIALLLLVAVAAPAQAHKLKVFAAAEGARVSGHVYVPGGARVAGAAVEVRVGEQVVGRLTSAADGTFAFTAETRADHRVTATIDGHQGAWTVRAEEPPPALPALADGASPAPAPPTPTPAEAAPGDTAALEQAVARQVAPLRAELQAWREEARWRDIAGGLGWIVGLFGIAAWVAARRRPGG